MLRHTLAGSFQLLCYRIFEDKWHQPTVSNITQGKFKALISSTNSFTHVMLSSPTKQTETEYCCLMSQCTYTLTPDKQTHFEMLLHNVWSNRWIVLGVRQSGADGWIHHSETRVWHEIDKWHGVKEDWGIRPSLNSQTSPINWLHRQITNSQAISCSNHKMLYRKCINYYHYHHHHHNNLLQQFLQSLFYS